MARKNFEWIAETWYPNFFGEEQSYKMGIYCSELNPN